MRIIARILGEVKRRVRPPTKEEQTDPEKAYFYAKDVIRRRWPEAEQTIAKNPWCAVHYASEVIGGRWPEAEPTIATDPFFAYYYADAFIKDRWPEAEEVIAKSGFKDEYLQAHPGALDDWLLNGWIDWLDT